MYTAPACLSGIAPRTSPGRVVAPCGTHGSTGSLAVRAVIDTPAALQAGPETGRPDTHRPSPISHYTDRGTRHCPPPWTLIPLDGQALPPTGDQNGMDKPAITIACTVFITATLAYARDNNALSSMQSTDFLYDSGPWVAQPSWTAGPGPLRRADSPDPAGLTRHIQAVHLPAFELGPASATLSGDYLLGPYRAGLSSFPVQDAHAVLGQVSGSTPDTPPPWSGAHAHEHLLPLKGTWGHLASCTAQAWPEGPHAGGSQPDTWNLAPHCAPRYLSSLY